jgi:thiol-disulfide isomerase/thioredoxin
MIAPAFEELAGAKSRSGVAFTKVDLGVGMGSNVAGEWGVRVTPTFLFFLDGKKVRVLRLVLDS